MSNRRAPRPWKGGGEEGMTMEERGLMRPKKGMYCTVITESQAGKKDLGWDAPKQRNDERPGSPARYRTVGVATHGLHGRSGCNK